MDGQSPVRASWHRRPAEQAPRTRVSASSGCVLVSTGCGHRCLPHRSDRGGWRLPGVTCVPSGSGSAHCIAERWACSGSGWALAEFRGVLRVLSIVARSLCGTRGWTPAPPVSIPSTGSFAGHVFSFSGLPSHPFSWGGRALGEPGLSSRPQALRCEGCTSGQSSSFWPEFPKSPLLHPPPPIRSVITFKY